MTKIKIGVDPDSNQSGFAIYRDGNLAELGTLPLIDVYLSLNNMCERYGAENIEVHIENVKGVSGIFAQRTAAKNKAVALKMAQHVGMCKQVQSEVERIAERLGVKVVYHKVSKMWKKDKAQFELVTGWSGRSNEDSRSAAYFGWLGCK